MLRNIASFYGLLIMLTSFGWASQTVSQDVTRVEKIYIAPENLQLHNQKIFVYYDSSWQQVSALFSDTNGLFIERQPSPETWYCTICRTYHRVGQKCPSR